MYSDMARWTNPVYPEKGVCIIRERAGALAQSGWTIMDWESVNRPRVRNNLTKEEFALDRKLVEVPP